MSDLEHRVRPQEPYKNPVKEPLNPIPHSGIIPDIPAPEIPTEETELKHTLTVVDHFKIEGWSQILMTPQLDVEGMKDKVFFIQAYISSKIQQMGLRNEPNTYRSLLSTMDDQFRFTDLHRADVRINRVYDYLKTLEKSDKNNERLLSLIAKANKESKSFK